MDRRAGFSVRARAQPPNPAFLIYLNKNSRVFYTDKNPARVSIISYLSKQKPSNKPHYYPPSLLPPLLFYLYAGFILFCYITFLIFIIPNTVCRPLHEPTNQIISSSFNISIISFELYFIPARESAPELFATCSKNSSSVFTSFYKFYL